MKILAVDTSGFQGSVALSDDRSVIAERQLSAEGRRHAQTLVSEVDVLLKQQSLRPSDINAVAVSIGPGSFTGLRVGVVFAKTFAWANSAKLIAVDTLQAVAQQAGADHSIIRVISDAQRREVFLNEYIWDEALAVRVPVGDVRLCSVDSLAAESQTGLDVDSLLTGPGLIKFGAELSENHRLADPLLWNPHAGSVAELASIMIGNDDVADIYTLEPLYIRRSYAEEKAAK